MTNTKYVEMLDHIKERDGDSASHHRLPSWFKVPKMGGRSYLETMRQITHSSLHTVCQESRCPNKAECFSQKTVAFLILGDICTRACKFCHISKGIPKPADDREPERIMQAVIALGMKCIVLTSVNRDDLPDGGASQFSKVVHLLKNHDSSLQIEVLTGDFQGDRDALMLVLRSPIDVFNHNLETVPSLYPLIRPQSFYERSLNVLSQAKKESNVLTKSGLMLGLGESYTELLEVMDHLRSVECDILTLGQYARPSNHQVSVKRYICPEEFEELKRIAYKKGFYHVESGPLVRSSYHADRARVDSPQTTD